MPVIWQQLHPAINSLCYVFFYISFPFLSVFCRKINNTVASSQKKAARRYAKRQQIITKGNKIVGPSVSNLMVNLQHYVNKVSKYSLALTL